MPHVFVSSVIPAEADAVWSVIRDFNALPDWHPGIAESRIEDNRPSDAVGCVRNFQLTDGGTIREQLLSLDDPHRTVVYSILESPLPISDYIATLRLLPITDGGQCYAEWSATFACAEEDREAMVDTVGNGVFQGGFDALKQRVAG
ncbi:MxaD family protein [Rhodovibrio sodomensis]|uniref:MxaD family protein n=1 Tax=Rhodovibrio sodomensis TaxID=1088 RepID=A0ABS1DJ82_9PROT|nr:SRPBCC family protein [Rhodovibrio sodomensis]MBK1670530.1 MxaD family protein [Rhodovibrio sodomensis]